MRRKLRRIIRKPARPLQGERRRLRALRLGLMRRQELVSPGLEPLEQLLEGRGADDAVELGAVVADQAHVLDADVVNKPAVALLTHLRLDGHLGALARQHLRAHGRVLAVDRLVRVVQLLAPVEVDLRDVGALEKVGEHLDELLLFRARTSVPVLAEGTLGGLVHVEDLFRHLPDRDSLVGLLERGIVQDLLHGVGVLLHLIRRGAGARGRRDGQSEPDHSEHREHRSHLVVSSGSPVWSPSLRASVAGRKHCAPDGRPLDAPLAPATPGASGISISRSTPQARRMSLTAVPSARLSGVTTIGARAGWLVVLVFSAYAVGQPAGNPPPQVTVNYRGTGVVLALLPPPSSLHATRPVIVIEHDPIKGLMDEHMSMPFIAASTQLFENLKAGDSIAFGLMDTPGALLVVTVERLMPR